MNETWAKDPELIQRARIVLVLFLSKKTKGELVELIMNWLDDSEIARFSHRYLDPSDLAYIEGRKEGGEDVSTVREIMMEFAGLTGLSPSGKTWRRYLWTDAFAVCNFLELYRQTGDKEFTRLALRLVEQVHHVLGRHREDDSRSGWISGLTEEEGARTPDRRRIENRESNEGTKSQGTL